MSKGRQTTSAQLLVADDLPNSPPIGTRELDVLYRLGALLDETLLTSENTVAPRKDASPSQAPFDELNDKRKYASRYNQKNK
jgi:hypothetical protein